MNATATPWMTFLWPTMLWAMVALPVIVLLYVFLITRRKKTSLRYANLGLVKEALGSRSAWRRHVPPVLLFLALATLLFASSRPAALITLPSAQETIVLAIDVSGSMRAADGSVISAAGRDDANSKVAKARKSSTGGTWRRQALRLPSAS